MWDFNDVSVILEFIKFRFVFVVEFVVAVVFSNSGISVMWDFDDVNVVLDFNKSSFDVVIFALVVVVIKSGGLGVVDVVEIIVVATGKSVYLAT